MLSFTMNHNLVLTHAITAVPQSTHKGGIESDLISDLIGRQRVDSCINQPDIVGKLFGLKGGISTVAQYLYLKSQL